MQSAMKTVIVFLLCTIATSFIHGGIIRCAINKRHYSILFVTRNEKEMYDKLLQSRDEMIKSKDEMLKSKDDLLKSKDDAIHILATSIDDLLKSKDDLLKSKVEMLSAANAEILYLQGRLTLRSVFEQFELRYEGYEGLPYTSIFTKGMTRRDERRKIHWKSIIENNAGGIKQYLGDTTTDWPSVAQSLYKLISKDIHNFDNFSKKVIINDMSLSYEMTTLAMTVCTMFPIKYEIISPSSLDQE